MSGKAKRRSKPEQEFHNQTLQYTGTGSEDPSTTSEERRQKNQNGKCIAKTGGPKRGRQQPTKGETLYIIKNEVSTFGEGIKGVWNRKKDKAQFAWPDSSKRNQKVRTMGERLLNQGWAGRDSSCGMGGKEQTGGGRPKQKNRESQRRSK